MRAFSLIEVIFVIVVLSIISYFAIGKFGNVVNLSIKTKISSDIAMIRLSLANEKQNLLLSNERKTIDTLDNAPINKQGELLFGGNNNIKLLNYPIISSSQESAKGGDWVKISTNKYLAFLDINSSVEFIFDNITNRFDCNNTDILCKEISQ